LKILLKHISVIQTGVFAKTVTEGDMAYLQVKHFDEYGVLFSSLLPDLNRENLAGKHLLKTGDILFSAKGAKNFASCYVEGNIHAVASTSFFVVRVKENYNNKIIPEYLVWFLNNPITLRLLKDQAIGTSIPSISKTVLEKLEVPIPDLNTQKIILQINQFRDRERELKQQIENLREKQIQQQIFNAIK
jgi:restriction endonuclease S subunit